jgi:phosphatidate cytidylyltransferase
VTEAPAPKSGRRTWSDLGPRFASALVLIPIAAGSVILGGYVFAVVIGLVFAGAYREWETMVTLRPLTPAGIVLIVAIALSALVYPAFGAFGSMAVVSVAAAIALALGGVAALWRVVGLLFFGLVVIAVLALRGTTQDGIFVGFYLGTVIWTTDTAAFFTGRQVGGEKLAPDISPSKTWSGAAGGLAVATVLGTALWIIFGGSPWWIGLLLSAALSIVGQLGDLTESALKRRFRVKDSGDIIPGHGGLMDRLDSISFGAIAAFLVGFLHAGYVAAASGLLHW